MNVVVGTYRIEIYVTVHAINDIGRVRIYTNVFKEIQENSFIAMIVSDPYYLPAFISEIFNYEAQYISERNHRRCKPQPSDTFL